MGKRAYGESRALLSEALTAEPDNFEARYTLAVLERAEGNHDQAIEVLTALTTEKPDFGRGFQEIGLCELALKREQQAVAAFEVAVERDGSLIDSWKFIAAYYRRVNDARTEQASKQVEFLAALPGELRTVSSYLAANRLADAERLCGYCLHQDTTHV